MFKTTLKNSCFLIIFRPKPLFRQQLSTFRLCLMFSSGLCSCRYQAKLYSVLMGGLFSTDSSLEKIGSLEPKYYQCPTYITGAQFTLSNNALKPTYSHFKAFKLLYSTIHPSLKINVIFLKHLCSIILPATNK